MLKENTLFKTKEEIQAWLDKMDVKNYIIHDDLAVSGYSLMFDNKNLSSLPFKVKSFKKFFFKNNQFSELNCPNFPDDLEDLSLDNNQFTVLPPLPKNLKRLSIKNNPISKLDILPSELIILNCESTNLTQLPSLPKTLRWLNINNTKFSTLPNLPEKLEILNCANNNLSVLPSLPNSLKELGCASNKIKSLVLPLSLEKLFCNNNHLTELVLPPKLKTLYCNKNQLSTLSLPNTIKLLWLEGNPIDKFNIPTHLERLSIYTSQMTHITKLPQNMRYVFLGVECIHCPTLDELSHFVSLLSTCTYLEGVALPNIDKNFKTIIKVNGKEEVKNYLSRLLSQLEKTKLEESLIVAPLTNKSPKKI